MAELYVDTQEALVNFFYQVACKNSRQLEQLSQQPGFRVEDSSWYFNLPDLYDYLCRQQHCFDSLEYPQFRRLIFNSPINATTRPYGAHIVIADNRYQVDQSEYAMIWQESENGST